MAPRLLAGCAPLDAGAAATLDALDRRSSVGAVGAGDLKQARAQEGLAMLRRGSRDGLGLVDGRAAPAAQQQLEQHADPGIGSGPCQTLQNRFQRRQGCLEAGRRAPRGCGAAAEAARYPGIGSGLCETLKICSLAFKMP